MKRLLLLSFTACIILSSCYRPQISLNRQERDKSISNQLKQTDYRKVKLKDQPGTEFYGIGKDTNGIYRIEFSRDRKRHYVFIYLKSTLVYLWVTEAVFDKKTRWRDGFYYFQDNALVYKEEPEPNFVSIEEMKILAEKYLQKVKTL